MSTRYDYEENDYDDDDEILEYADPNQCPECGDNLDEDDMCVHCDY